MDAAMMSGMRQALVCGMSLASEQDMQPLYLIKRCSETVTLCCSTMSQAPFQSTSACTIPHPAHPAPPVGAAKLLSMIHKLDMKDLAVCT